MRTYIFIILYLVVLVSCTHDDNLKLSFQVDGVLSHDIINVANSHSDYPDFPVDQLYITNDYLLQLSNSSGVVLDSWFQDLSTDFSFETTEDVLVKVGYPENQSFPMSHYWLNGEQNVLYGISSVEISMENTQFGCIAIYHNSHIQNVSINNTERLPFIETGESGYDYSFVDPSDRYYVVITDINNKRYFIEISNIQPNDLVRVFLEENSVDGSFQIVIDWDYKEYFFEVDPIDPNQFFSLNHDLQDVYIDNPTNWFDKSGSLNTITKGSSILVEVPNWASAKYDDFFKKSKGLFSTTSTLEHFFYNGSIKQLPFNEVSNSNSTNNSIVVVFKEIYRTSFAKRTLVGVSPYNRIINSVNDELEWYLLDDQGNYTPLFYQYSNEINLRVRYETINGLIIQNLFDDGEVSTVDAFYYR